ncbi:hypothetical protein L3X38_045101 [Prunus dulcis]|uniref:Uncharacterized protein n=1 Tax=Prunus dulcis TaxID=3755 RepID=A0AAD4YNW1_PRUDU|nr:hypothetical protein L3X38_045101 [Prunus dulcis]
MGKSIVSKSVDYMVQKIHHLQYVLFTLLGDSRLNALEEEVRLLWAASRSSTTWIFNGCLSGSKDGRYRYRTMDSNSWSFYGPRVTRFGF